MSSNPSALSAEAQARVAEMTAATRAAQGLAPTVGDDGGLAALLGVVLAARQEPVRAAK